MADVADTASPRVALLAPPLPQCLPVLASSRDAMGVPGPSGQKHSLSSHTPKPFQQGKTL